MARAPLQPVRCLFTVSETKGDKLTSVELSVWDLETAHRELDIKRVPFEMIDGNTAGYSIGREYAINPIAVRPTKAMFHEMGHIILGHTMPDQIEEYVQPRGIYEFQAEATAFLTMNELEQLEKMRRARTEGTYSTGCAGTVRTLRLYAKSSELRIASSRPAGWQFRRWHEIATSRTVRTRDDHAGRPLPCRVAPMAHD